MSEEAKNHADDSVTLTGDGPNIYNSFAVPESVAKPLLLFLISVCLLALVFSAIAMVNSFEIAPRQIARASESVDRANDRLENNTRYLIQIQYWAQLVYAQGQAQGFKIPPPPPRKE